MGQIAGEYYTGTRSPVRSHVWAEKLVCVIERGSYLIRVGMDGIISLRRHTRCFTTR